VNSSASDNRLQFWLTGLGAQVHEVWFGAWPLADVLGNSA